MKPKVKKPVKRFEPITEQQNRKLHAIIYQRRLSEKHLYEMVEKLIGIPSISSLSKQEASFIIRRLEGTDKRYAGKPFQLNHPLPAHSSQLPSLAHIRGIRTIAKELGWDKTHLNNWLKKYMKKARIRDLDPESARKAFIGLRKIHAATRKDNRALHK